MCFEALTEYIHKYRYIWLVFEVKETPWRGKLSAKAFIIYKNLKAQKNMHIPCIMSRNVVEHYYYALCVYSITGRSKCVKCVHKFK